MWDSIMNIIFTADYDYVFWNCWFYWSLAYYVELLLVCYIVYKIDKQFTYSTWYIIIYILLGIFGPVTFIISIVCCTWFFLEEYGDDFKDSLTKERIIRAKVKKLENELDRTL